MNWVLRPMRTPIRDGLCDEPLGKEYDAVKDLEAYKNFLNKMRVFTNLKIIGIGKGRRSLIEPLPDMRVLLPVSYR